MAQLTNMKNRNNAVNCIRDKRACHTGYLAGLCLLFSGLSVHAAEWDNSLGLGVEASYYDNILYAAPGEEVSDKILILTPALEVHGEGARASLDLSYRLQSINYASNNEYDGKYEQYSADSSIELGEDWLFLDLASGRTQRAIAATGVIPIDNIGISSNRTNATTYTVSPYISTRFSENSAMLLRYTRDRISYDDDVPISPISDARRYDFWLTGAGMLDWRISASRNEFDVPGEDSGADNYYSDMGLRLSYDTGSQFTPHFSYGVEDNRIQGSVYENGGSYWEAGFAWEISSRTTLSASTGKRFYGKSHAFSLTVAGRYMNINADYSEDVTSDAQGYALRNISNLPPGGSYGGFRPITNDPYINKRMAAGVIFSKSKTSLNLSVYSSKRQFLSSGDADRNYGSRLAWGWAISSRTTTSFDVNVQRYKSYYSDITNTLMMLGLSARHQTTETLATEFGYRQRRQDSGGAAYNYRQNILFFSLTAEF